MHIPEDATGSEQPFETDDLSEIVRRSLLAAQHLKDIEEQVRELARKGADLALKEKEMRAPGW